MSRIRYEVSKLTGAIVVPKPVTVRQCDTKQEIIARRGEKREQKEYNVREMSSRWGRQEEVQS